MRLLYVASAVEAGGTSGGATHIEEVACGLAALGHEVLVLARTSDGRVSPITNSSASSGNRFCFAFRPITNHQPRANQL